MQSYLKISSTNLFLLGVLIATIGCTGTVDAPPQVDIGTVSLSIDFPADTQLADIDVEVGCWADATVFEVMQRAEADGVLEFEHSSNVIQESASVFVNMIGGVGGNNDQAWTYYVNDELAKEGCGTCAVKPGDGIHWVYGEPPVELN